MDSSTFFFQLKLISIIASPFFYLTSFGLTTSTLIKYYNGHGDTFQFPRSSRHIFYVLLIILLLAHVVNAAFFKLTFPSNEQPVRAAYFLPLIQFYRLVKLMLKSWSLKDFEDVAEEKVALYNILSVTLETGPLLFVQIVALRYCYFIAIDTVIPGHQPDGRYHHDSKAKAVVILSILFAFVSSAYNGASAALSTTSKDLSLVRKASTFLLTGLFIVSTLIQRCITVFLSNKLFDFFSLVVVILPALVLNWLAYVFVLSAHRTTESKRRTCFVAFVYGYMTFTMGPLYPLSRIDKQATKTPAPGEYLWTRAWLLLVHWLPDLVIAGFFFYMLVVSRGWKRNPEWINHPKVFGDNNAFMDISVNEIPGYLLAPYLSSLILYLLSAAGTVLMDMNCNFPQSQQHA